MRVGLFVTCLVDMMRPSVGFAAIKLLEAGGAEVVVPPGQTCCGQPAYNSGDRADAKALAAKVVAEFEGCDYVVAPSGSCSGMIRTHYGDLLDDDPALAARAQALAARTFELTDFLVNVLKLESVPGRFEGTVTYHDSCAGLREMGVKAQPRALLAKVPGLARGDGRARDLLWLRRHLLDQVRRDLGAARGQQVPAHRQQRREDRRAGRHGLPDEHGGPDAPARRRVDAVPARRRGAGGREALRDRSEHWSGKRCKSRR
jgi:hypothetical protein